MLTLRDVAGPIYDRLWRLEKHFADQYWSIFYGQYLLGIRQRRRKSELQVAHMSMSQALGKVNLVSTPAMAVFAVSVGLGSYLYILAAILVVPLVIIYARIFWAAHLLAQYFKPLISAEAIAARDTPDGNAEDLSGHRWA